MFGSYHTTLHILRRRHRCRVYRSRHGKSGSIVEKQDLPEDLASAQKGTKAEWKYKWILLLVGVIIGVVLMFFGSIIGLSIPMGISFKALIITLVAILMIAVGFCLWAASMVSSESPLMPLAGILLLIVAIVLFVEVVS